VWSGVLSAVIIKSNVFRDVTPYSPVNVYSKQSSVALGLLDLRLDPEDEVVRFPKTSVSFYQTK
jgi:hypothetical protein